MMECISQKYKDLDEEAHTARKLQADFDRADTEDYKKTLNRTVSEIILYTDLTVGITVDSKEQITVIFVGGLKVVQPLID